MVDKNIEKIVKSIADETISIDDFILSAILTSKDKDETEIITKRVVALRNTLKKVGIPLTDPWNSIVNTSSIQQILDSPSSSKNTTAHFGYIEKKVQSLYTRNKDKFTDTSSIKYPFTDKIGLLGGIAKELGGDKAFISRDSKNFTGMPRASIAIPKIVAAISAIKDPTVRAAVAFNTLVPLRGTELWGKAKASLKLSDIDFEEGFIREFKRGNKTRPALRISTVALEILKDAAEVARKNSNLPDDEVFIFPDVTQKKVYDGLMKEGELAKKFATHEALMGRLIIGPKDLRKIVPSLLAHRLGSDAGVVSDQLGHTVQGDDVLGAMKSMTTKYYIAKVDDPLTDPILKSFESLENLFATEMGATTLNEIPAGMGVSAKNLTDPNAKAYIVPESSFGKPIEVPELTEEQKKSLKLQRERADSELRLSKATNETLILQQEIESDRLKNQVLPEKKVASSLEGMDKKVQENKLFQAEYDRIDKIPEEDRNPLDANRHTELTKKLKIKLKVPIEKPSGLDYSDIFTSPLKRIPSIIKLGKKTLKSFLLPMVGGVAGTTAFVADQVAEAALSSGPTGDTPDLEDYSQTELLELLQSKDKIETKEPVANFASDKLQENLAENKAFEARRNNPETTALKEDMDKVFGKKPLAEVIDKRDKESLDTSTRKIEEGLAKYNNSPLLKEYSGFATRP